MSARATKKRGRSLAFTAGSPLVGRQPKRGGKSPGPTASPGPPGSKGVAALALAMDESDIVLDRLGKEIVTLLKQGGPNKDIVRRRLRLGINEVTKFLEATAAAAASGSRDPSPLSSSTTTTTTTSKPSRRPPGEGERPKTSCRGADDRPREQNEREEGEGLRLPSSPPTPPHAPGIVVFCRDVRPSRLVAHVHSLVALTATPYLVLSGSSSSLGRVFGCKTMAAMAICPARGPPPPPPPPAPPSDSPRSPDRGGKTEGAGAETGGVGGVGGGGGVTGGDGVEAEGGDDRAREGGSVRDGGSDPAAAEEGGRVGVHAERRREEAAGEQNKEESPGRTGRAGGVSAEERAASGDRARAASGDRSRADEDVDSLVEFLQRKVRGPP